MKVSKKGRSSTCRRRIAVDQQPVGVVGAVARCTSCASSAVYPRLNGRRHQRRWRWCRGRDGKDALYNAARQHRGLDHWVTLIGKPQRAVQPPPPTWTPDKVGRELRAYLADKEHFPGSGIFRKGGKEPLYDAARRHGGLDHWAGVVGKPRRRRSAA